MAKIGHYAKGYRLCKGMTLAQKIKLKKRCEKGHWHLIRVTLCKKRLKKTANIRQNDKFLKMAKIGHYAKAIGFAKGWVSLKY